VKGNNEKTDLPGCWFYFSNRNFGICGQWILGSIPFCTDIKYPEVNLGVHQRTPTGLMVGLIITFTAYFCV
jgi:hypothetical protein